MNDLFELLVALGIIVFGLLGSRKKKPVPPARQRPRTAQPRPRPAASQPVRRTVEPIRRAPLRATEPDPLVVSLEADAVEAVAAGVASHQRFHRLYHPLTTLPAEIEVPEVTARMAQLRQAILWQEILGPPKGLQ